MKNKLKTYLLWFAGIVITLTIIFGCAMLTNAWWSSLGAVTQQAMLALAGVGVAYYCVIPVIGISIVSYIIYLVYFR